MVKWLALKNMKSRMKIFIITSRKVWRPILSSSKYTFLVDENDICISLILRPLTDVIDTKPAMVEAQDYYEPSLRASSSYEILCRDETWTSDLLDESSSMKSGIHRTRMSDNKIQSVDSDVSKTALHGNGVIVQNFVWTGKWLIVNGFAKITWSCM